MHSIVNQYSPLETFFLFSVHCNCVQRLSNASNIQALAMDSRNQLVTPVRQLRLFPNITFTCAGNIVGWRLAAIDHIRNGRPELSVWRPDGVNRYAKVTGQRIDSCTVAESTRTLGTSTVMIHENILDSPIPFEAGHVLGVLFVNLPQYIPLLYNVSGSDGSERFVSYYESTLGSPQNDIFTLTADNVAQDTLFPLISLEICKSKELVSSICNINLVPRPGESNWLVFRRPGFKS